MNIVYQLMYKMKKLIITFFLLILINQTLAITSENYAFELLTTSSGGNNLNSTNYENDIILGTISQVMSSDNYTLITGFWFATLEVEGDDGGGSAVPDQPTPKDCESEWECSSWTFCWTGTQERICIDLNECENSTRPSEFRNCTIWESIKEKAKEGMCKLPSIWGRCIDGYQKRTISEWINDECVEYEELKECTSIILWSRLKTAWESTKQFCSNLWEKIKAECSNYFDRIKGKETEINETEELEEKKVNRLTILWEQICDFFRDLYYKIKWETITTYDKLIK